MTGPPTALTAGFLALARVVAGTLGPRPAVVLNQIGRGFEALDDAATVVRRVVHLADPRLRAGASVLRDLVTAVGHRAGDGGATATVLARDIALAAHRMVAAGAAAVRVGDGILAATDIAVREIVARARPLTDETSLARLARAAVTDDALADVLGEMFDVLGPDGAVAVEDVDVDCVDHEYLTGARFRGRPTDRAVLRHGTAELILTDAAVAIVLAPLTEFRDVAPIMEAGRGRPLLVVAPDITGEAATALTMNLARGLPVYGAALTAASNEEDLADLAALCSAAVLSEPGGRPAAAATAEDLGRVDRLTLGRAFLTVTVDEPDESRIKERLTRLAALGAAPNIGADDERRLWVARGRLAGRVGVLRVGGHTEVESALRRTHAAKAVRLLRGVATDGVVCGGGVALLDAVTAVRRAGEFVADRDEQAGFEAVARGLQGPFLQLVRNGGRREPRVALAAVQVGPPGLGYDVVGDRYADLAAIGVQDSAAVLRDATRAAGATARLLVTAHQVVPVQRRGGHG
ncbi:TCP-1/cpn60 chaperonin family protein [Micromonospora sp. NPDC051300]|uniref:TCP-1/cpn60 chaperonin family protein n=1 Tax=Micromonospora sp. NPDC051300 TaxID=3364286 RepID=UPI0037A67A9A